MINVFLKKTMASMLNIPSEQIDAIMEATEVFRSGDIDRNLAMKVFDKLSKKTPKEINNVLNMIDRELT
jgi:hypothetical protein